jgi:ribosome-associated heat shock protein Hsp15
LTETLRLDKWLWFARFFKTRSLATKFCVSGRLRVNGTIVPKAHALVRVGDVLTFPLGPHVRVIKVARLGERRGPAPEAQTLYDDLAPPLRRTEGAPEPAHPGERSPHGPPDQGGAAGHRAAAGRTLRREGMAC